MYPELQATVAATNKNLKTMWEKDNVDDRDFVSTAKAMSNEMAEYWVERNRRMATEKKEAAEKKETAPAPPLAGPEAYMEIPIAEEPSIQKLSKEIEEYEHGR
uniref:Uncharacterized protein n=1 Tax=Chromera velia CCMP2878 TaxID=1169474 RepID=A0A0G4GW94_9ALVE|eukprot:Cvel_23657.t1-p1 / transcript=Cvel_23657.t1 / gene=Cvel_23657 / organism=Chromera_velia_CCMP2878 / gene_product=hypothetical protein / transcript_product=hypothetical protein / location=Cvel_scaffold2463:3924-4372(+) / protein_length=102 / sequence_SO=supercontig / SO=protein_coding / is_pseudo=false